MPGMPLSRSLPALSVILLLALGGCGASEGGDAAETKAFNEDGFDITFDYPKEMSTGDSVEVAQTAGSQAKGHGGGWL